MNIVRHRRFAGTLANRLEDLLADVVWAPNPADEAIWPAVVNWTTSP